MPTSHGAAGPSAGTLWQNQRMLCALLDEVDADATVGLEISNDIVVLKATGMCATSIQNKHSLNDGAITLKSRAWWGSATVWLDLLEDPTTTSDTEFVLSSTNSVNPSGEFYPFTQTTTTTADQRTALLDALQRAAAHPSTENTPDCTKWRDAAPEKRAQVVARLKIAADQPSINASRDEVAQRLRARSFHERAVDEASDELVGWVELKIRERITPTGCKITVAEFRQKLGLLRDKYTLSSLPRLPASDVDYETELATDATYLRQLQFIKTEREELVLAMNTYAEANKHRKFWLNEGLLGEDRIEHFEKQLTQQWTTAKGEHSSETEEVRRGKKIYYQCLHARGRLGSEDAEPDMVAGNLHILSQKTIVGWHPRFSELLGGK